MVISKYIWLKTNTIKIQLEIRLKNWPSPAALEQSVNPVLIPVSASEKIELCS